MLSGWVSSHVVSQHKHSRLWVEATVLLLAHRSLWVTNLELELACLKLRSSDRDRWLSVSGVLQKNPLSLCSPSASSWHVPFPLHLLFPASLISHCSLDTEVIQRTIRCHLERAGTRRAEWHALVPRLWHILIFTDRKDKWSQPADPRWEQRTGKHTAMNKSLRTRGTFTFSLP